MTRFRKLRDDLSVVRQETPDGILYIIKDPEEGTYYKFEEEDYSVIECFRGAESLEEVIERYETSHPGRTLTTEATLESQAMLEEMGFLERTVAEKNLMILEKVRDSRHKKTAAGEGKNMFFITFPAIDPDRLFNRIHPYIRFFWQPWFVSLCFAAMAAMTWVFVARWERLSAATIDFYNFTNKTAYDIFLILVVMFIIDMIHEFAHGLTCKNFGGEVHEIGFVLFYFTPAYYCDVNDAYLFEKTSHKLWVTFAGSYIELLICSLATFVWLVNRPDSFLSDLCYMTMLYTGFSTVVFNINPLVKLDGYYVLMDWLEIPDLRERSFEYLGFLAQSQLLGMKAERPVTTRRQRRIFTIYGLLAINYTVGILLFVFLLAKNWLNGLFPGWGLPLVLGIAFLIIRKHLGPAAGFLHRMWREKKEDWMTRRAWAMISGGAVVVTALVFVPRFPVMVRSPVVLEPERIVFLAAKADGMVTRILAREGNPVRKGDLLAVLRNDDLELDLHRARSRLRLAESEARAHRSRGEMARAVEAEREAKQLSERLANLLVQKNSLELRAPADGVLLTARVEDSLGTYYEAGEPILELGLTRRMRAMVRVSEWDIRRLDQEQRVRLRLDAFPYRSFEGEVLALAPAAEGRSASPREDGLGEDSEEERLYETFEVRVLLDNPHGELRPGMGGVAKVYTRPRTIAARILRASSDLTWSIVW